MKRLLPILLLLTVLISLLVLASCEPKQSERGRGTIRIGYLGDLSGVTYNFGQSARNGVLMAAGEIDQAGGLQGRQIDVVIEDDQGKPEFAATQIGKLIDAEKVIAVIVGGTSNDSRAAAPKAQVSRIPLISPSSTDPAVTQIGDYIFRTCFIDAFQG